MEFDHFSFVMCWDNFIGVDSTCTPISGSGYNFIDVGISKSELDSYIGAEFENGQELAQNKVNFAAKSVQSVLNTSFGGKFKIASLLDNQRVGVFQDNKIQDAAAAGTLKGIQLEVCNTQSYLNFNLTAISLQVENTGPVDVDIYDLIQDKLLDTVTVDTVAGQIVRIPVNFSYLANRQKLNLFIGYNATFPSYRTNVYQGGCSSCNGSDWRFSSKYVRNQAGTIGVASPKLDQNVDSSNNTGGLSIEYGVSCDFSQWMCSIKASVALAVLYRASEMIMSYALSQKQWNSNTAIRREDVKERKKEYGDEFKMQMAEVLSNMTIPTDSTCFQCDGPAKTTLKLP